MKFFALAVLMAFSTLTFSPLQADEAAAGSAAGQSSKHTPYHGTITAIDMSAGTVTVQTSHGAMTMTINADTKFRGGIKTLADLKMGDKVSGSFMMDDSGKMMAVSMKAYSSKG